jgi:hypothetical protein
LLLLVLVVSVLAMALLPWQQTSRGSGQVVAYAPQERQQSIESPTKGVVARIADGLVDGSEIKKGQFILELQPFAANMAEQLEGQLSDLNAKLGTANKKVEAYQKNVLDYTEARDFAVKSANDMVSAAEAKLASKQKEVPGYESKVWQAKLDLDRQKRLSDKGYKPKREVAVSNLDAIREAVVGLQKEVAAKEAEREEKRLVSQTKIDYAEAMRQDALGAVATIKKEVRGVEMKRGELERLIVTAPRDGKIFRMPVFELGDTLKEGDSILTLVPEASQMAVALNVRGNDMPLVQLGQEVRLRFEGWPAVQFAGWPSVSVGTFSGLVSTVDATDNGKGEFRILVTPNPDSPAWPSDRYLRQGVRVNGWVMMRQVSLGYELWRQLNGFPIMISDEEPQKELKKPKLPK